MHVHVHDTIFLMGSKEGHYVHLKVWSIVHNYAIVEVLY